MSPVYIPGQGWGTGGSSAAAAAAVVPVGTANGRLTLVSGTPVMTTSQTAKTTLYYTPHEGNQIALFSGGAWELLSFSEASLGLSGFAANKNFDIFGYSSGGTLTLEAVEWTNDSTRAVALAQQDGVWCKTGAPARRYLGTIRTTGVTGQCEFSFGGDAAAANLFVWNESNRVFVPTMIHDTTNSWTYGNVGAWRAANNSSNYRANVVIGRKLEALTATYQAFISTAASTAGAANIGVNSTTARSGFGAYATGGNAGEVLSASWSGFLEPGFSFISAIEYSSGGTSTIYGDNGANPVQTGLIVGGYF